MGRSFAVNTVWDPVLDFYCPEHKLAIEIQGGIHDDVLRSEYDGERLAYLESQGIGVLIFENRELLDIPDYGTGAFDLRCLDNHPVCGKNKDAGAPFS